LCSLLFYLKNVQECSVFGDPSWSGHGARIWGEHGQSALERPHICVLNCGPTGSESLKNLVLGGIGSFTVVDASKVCASDLGNNYFFDWDSLGQSKAKTVSALLHELNDAVDAKFMEELPEALLESNPAFFPQFTLVIATQVKLQMSAVPRVLSFCI
jgi:amyloid beta precursor protein binding protein 1